MGVLHIKFPPPLFPDTQAAFILTSNHQILTPVKPTFCQGKPSFMWASPGGFSSYQGPQPFQFRLLWLSANAIEPLLLFFTVYLEFVIVISRTVGFV